MPVLTLEKYELEFSVMILVCFRVGLEVIDYELA